MRLSKTRAIDFRVSTCPTLFGEKIVCVFSIPRRPCWASIHWAMSPSRRALPQVSREAPGHDPGDRPHRPGKTVSLYTGLNILNNEDTNISTAEDPAEINLPGVTRSMSTTRSASPSPPHCAPSCVRIRTSSWSAKSVTWRPRRSPSRPRKRSPRDVHAAHQRCAADADASGGHGREALRHRHFRQPDHCAAPGAPAVLACKPRRCSAEALLKEGFQEDDVRPASIFGPKGCTACTDGYKGRCGIYQVMPVTEALAASSWPAAVPSTSTIRR